MVTDIRNTSTVLRMIRTCTCGTEFHGRADAQYCSPACRQKAYRDRAEQREPDQDHIDLTACNFLRVALNANFSDDKLATYSDRAKDQMVKTLEREIKHIKASKGSS